MKQSFFMSRFRIINLKQPFKTVFLEFHVGLNSCVKLRWCQDDQTFQVNSHWTLSQMESGTSYPLKPLETAGLHWSSHRWTSIMLCKQWRRAWELPTILHLSSHLAGWELPHWDQNTKKPPRYSHRYCVSSVSKRPSGNSHSLWKWMVEDEWNPYFAVSFRLGKGLKNAGPLTLWVHPGWKLWERSAIGWTRRIKQLGPIGLFADTALARCGGIGEKIILDLILKLSGMMRVSSMYHEIVTKCSKH